MPVRAVGFAVDPEAAREVDFLSRHDIVIDEDGVDVGYLRVRRVEGCDDHVIKDGGAIARRQADGPLAERVCCGAERRIAVDACFDVARADP